MALGGFAARIGQQARVVDQHVQSRHPSGNVSGEGAHRGQAGDVAHLYLDVAVGESGQDLAARRFATVSVAHRHQHGRAQSSQCATGGLADPRVRSGDQCRGSGECAGPRVVVGPAGVSNPEPDTGVAGYHCPVQSGVDQPLPGRKYNHDDKSASAAAFSPPERERLHSQDYTSPDDLLVPSETGLIAPGQLPKLNTPKRTMTRRARAIASKLRLRGQQHRDQAQAAVRRITGELAGIAEAAMREAAAVIRNATRALCTAAGQRRGRLRRAVNDLHSIVGRTEHVVAQARSRLAGVMPESSNRLVSLHDVDARPIRKGRLGKPVEFGYKAQIVDNADGVILDHNVEIGNPPDAPQLVPAIERITARTGRTPRAVTADRGYGQAIRGTRPT